MVSLEENKAVGSNDNELKSLIKKKTDRYIKLCIVTVTSLVSTVVLIPSIGIAVKNDNYWLPLLIWGILTVIIAFETWGISTLFRRIYEDNLEYELKHPLPITQSITNSLTEMENALIVGARLVFIPIYLLSGFMCWFVASKVTKAMGMPI